MPVYIPLWLSWIFSFYCSSNSDSALHGPCRFAYITLFWSWSFTLASSTLLSLWQPSLGGWKWGMDTLGRELLPLQLALIGNRTVGGCNAPTSGQQLEALSCHQTKGLLWTGLEHTKEERMRFHRAYEKDICLVNVWMCSKECLIQGSWTRWCIGKRIEFDAFCDLNSLVWSCHSLPFAVSF